MTSRLGINTSDVLDARNFTPEPNTGCWIWLGNLAAGYPVIHTRKGTRRIHREVCAASGAEVAMHRCDNTACINPSHLKRGTQLENIADRHLKRRDGHTMGRGGPEHSSHKMKLARLAAMDVPEVIKLDAEGLSVREIALRLRIPRDAVMPALRNAGVVKRRIPIPLTRVQIDHIRVIDGLGIVSRAKIALAFGVAGSHLAKVLRS